KGLPQDPVADGHDLYCRGDRKRGGLSHRVAPDNRGGAARGRRCAQRQMVSPGSSKYGSAERRLQELGIVLPNAPHPLGAYVETVQTGSLLFLSGMLPVKDGKLQYIGRLGKEINESAGRDALLTATLNAL